MTRKLVLIASVLLTAALFGAESKTILVEDFDSTWTDGRWQFSNGGEFPGAKGSFERSKDAAHAGVGGAFGGKLNFDFRGGGNYVAAMLPLKKAPSIRAVRLWVKKPAENALTIRYTDSTGQTLQKRFEAPVGKWADVEIGMEEWAAHWGGANDGIVHGAPHMLAILIDNDALKEGALLFDDLRLIEGEVAAPKIWTYTAARFEPGEGWHGWGGSGATARLDGRKWHFDFSRGGYAALGVREFSLLGTPKEIVLRVRGNAAGHPLRVQIATHFMTFERTVDGAFSGEAGADGVRQIVIAAPPGEGWHWFHGENDGKVHGPLRITGIFLESAGKQDSGDLELVEVQVRSSCLPRKVSLALPETRVVDGRTQFVATIRSLAAEPVEADFRWTTRNWDTQVLDSGTRKITIPPKGEALEVSAAAPAGEHRFLECEMAFVAPEQDIPSLLAYHVAPLETPGGPELDPASPFGMGVYLCRYGGDPKSLKEMDRAAQVAQDAGIKWSREDFSWSRIEPSKGKFDWSYYDKMVEAATRHGITLYGILGYWSPWTKPYTPEGIADYCRFATACAEHYRGKIQHWEIWNEPNIFFWQGPKEMYAELLKQAYAAVKLGNPDAKVLGCSTAGIDSKFIKQTMALGAPFDILTIHPYRTQLNDTGFMNELRAVAELAKNPDGKPRQAWITEMGWATHVPHNTMAMDFQVTSQRKQAQFIARAYIDAIASGVSPNLCWYDFRNDGTDLLNFEHNMGIVMRDFRPKPAYRAYATMTSLLKGKQSVKALDLGAGTMAFQFAGTAGDSKPVIALWSVSGDKSVSVPAEKPVIVTGLMGDTHRVVPKAGKAEIALSDVTVVFVTQE